MNINQSFYIKEENQSMAIQDSFKESIQVGQIYEEKEIYKQCKPISFCGMGTLQKKYPVQMENIKSKHLYDNIERKSNKWMEMACDEALESVKKGGGPFGAIIVQIDNETKEVIRYWKSNNRVTELNDPTAHAEIMALRYACYELGVFDLGTIYKQDSKLFQKGKTSHCEIYSSTEPCPMCFSAIFWSRIPILFFAATRFDASAPGVNFSDKELYQELSKSYKDKSIKVFQVSCPNSLDAFNLWKNSEKIMY